MNVDSIPVFSLPDIKEYHAKVKAVFPDMDAEHILSFGNSMLLVHTLLATMERYFKTEGISKARFLILVHLFLNSPQDGECISDLRASYPISSATMTVVLDTLEKEHMVERVPNPQDRRKVNVKITDKGKAFMKEFLPRHQKNVTAISSELTEEEMTTLPIVLEKLITGAETFLQNSKS